MHYEIGLKIMKLKYQREKKTCIPFIIIIICFHFYELLGCSRIIFSSFSWADILRNWGSDK